LKYWLITERFYRESSEQQWLQVWQQPNDGRKKQDLVKLDNLNNIQLGEVSVEFVICTSTRYSAEPIFLSE
jgi:hypothetical protein